MSGDTAEDVGEPDLRVDVVHLNCDDQAVHGGRALPPTVGAGEQPRLSSERNLAVILPISGKMSSSNIVGTHITVGRCGAF
jgi:hypothetical protein